MSARRGAVIATTLALGLGACSPLCRDGATCAADRLDAHPDGPTPADRDMAGAVDAVPADPPPVADASGDRDDADPLGDAAARIDAIAGDAARTDADADGAAVRPPCPPDCPEPPAEAACGAPAATDGSTRYTCRFARLHVEESSEMTVVQPSAPSGAVALFLPGRAAFGQVGGGVRAQGDALLGRWAAAGVTGVAIDVAWPGAPVEDPRAMTPVADAAAALVWIHRFIAAFGGDPARVVVVGHWESAIVAHVVATDRRWLDDAFAAAGLPAVEPAGRVAGVVNLAGPPDLEARDLGLDADNWLTRRLSASVRRDVSPLNLLSQVDESEWSPPALLVAGGIGTVLGPPLERGTPAGYLTGMKAYADRAPRVTVLQPLLDRTAIVLEDRVQCFVHLTQLQILEILARGPEARLTPEAGQHYSGELTSPWQFRNCDIGGALLAAGNPAFVETVDAFVQAPHVPPAWDAWATPAFSHNSIPPGVPPPHQPDIDGSFRFNAGGGPVPGAGGAVWRGTVPGTQLEPARDRQRVTNSPAFRDGVPVEVAREGGPAPLPRGLFHFVEIAPAAFDLPVEPRRSYDLTLLTAHSRRPWAYIVVADPDGAPRERAPEPPGAEPWDEREIFEARLGDVVSGDDGWLRLHVTPTGADPVFVGGIVLTPR